MRTKRTVVAPSRRGRATDEATGRVSEGSLEVKDDLTLPFYLWGARAGFFKDKHGVCRIGRRQFSDGYRQGVRREFQRAASVSEILYKPESILSWGEFTDGTIHFEKRGHGAAAN